ncbi:unnamed protein product, partial [Amoebophrya sp. A25]
DYQFSSLENPFSGHNADVPSADFGYTPASGDAGAALENVFFAKKDEEKDAGEEDGVAKVVRTTVSYKGGGKTVRDALQSAKANGEPCTSADPVRRYLDAIKEKSSEQQIEVFSNAAQRTCAGTDKVAWSLALFCGQLFPTPDDSAKLQHVTVGDKLNSIAFEFNGKVNKVPDLPPNGGSRASTYQLRVSSPGRLLARGGSGTPWSVLS